jgi:hypothetical protein
MTGSESIRVTRTVALPPAEIELRTSRSSAKRVDEKKRRGETKRLRRPPED